MSDNFSIIFGRELSIERVVVETHDRKPIQHTDTNDMHLTEMGINSKDFERTAREYKERYKAENPLEVMMNNGRIPLPFTLAYKFPSGEYYLPFKSHPKIVGYLADSNSLYFLFHEIKGWSDKGSYLIYGATIKPDVENWNGSWAVEILDIEKHLSSRGAVADRINRLGFNYSPGDITFYLSKYHY